jgi:uncharacterized protein
LILYLDTSLVVASMVTEPSTQRVQDWLGRQHSRTLYISDWVVTEFSAALSLKLRTGQIASAARTAALAGFAGLQQRSVGKIAVLGEDFRSAAQMADMDQSGLRAGDALHMAIARRIGAELCTLDVRLSQAGETCGVSARLV